MNIDMLQVAEAVAREKSVERELVIEAMEQAIKTAARRTYGAKAVDAKIDRSTGEIGLWHVRTVVDEVEDYENELSLEQAQGIDASAQIGTEFRDVLPPIELGRIAAQTAKQVINQKIREAERNRVIEEYEPRVGELITGIVKRVERGNVYIDLGRGEGVMYREDLLPRESFRQGDRVRALLREVRHQSKGPAVLLSRSDAGMVLRLFEQEVPEIQDGLVSIQAVARDPGSRSKIAVVSLDAGVDPVGACVGMRGSRVQAVVNELHGERVDIIEWTEDPAAFVINALAPAEIERVLVDEENKLIEVAVSDDNLAIAIGRRGQNVRLASELTDWKIEIITTGEEQKKRTEEVEVAREVFRQGLDVDDAFANLLIAEGFMTLEELAYSDIDDIATVPGLNEELAQEIQNRSRNELLNKALKDQGDAGVTLSDLPGMNQDIAIQLAALDMLSVESLADAAMDDLESVDGLNREQTEALILAAREASGWFD
ncbi:MAG: transcription termination/antitermination protein NusA [Zetaproteobacteria bacterium CG_4_9_14_3_um_filter_49_83]|nr:MAG: transcription termination/antitermination protein NusA [Zetaproteobacteria bacterium CG1_02_49_23]PIQ33033.1 MAG: transcription termination/antitermination protein NusA [Zetaproteobacteria bacterium CG17_big_fil_post_rev_8_21_14_2_50_50_13]PIV29430.1 MAG: transcription termination/antitermination protein NusA [Zetaproteobacteria bacterium CG02_land_8_20_14_3_00_50_9]PIY55190.1 MAG: transcription termination/antitermination protein NusA [Zetaproteobacteria bacterium CG_4_10_14_0_8_um_filt